MIVAIGLPLLIVVLLVISKIKSLYSKLRDLETELEKTIIENQQQKETIQNLKTELELQKIENLRFALNPHTFKNTLTTIENMAKRTYESVHSLSGIFDYMLYDAKSKFVSLDQELRFIRRYLKLYEMRLSPVVDVKIYVHPTIDDKWSKTKKIAPLIFAHFIENAFKHGELAANDGFFTITIEPIDDHLLVYSVKNRIKRFKNNTSGGIGNNNFNDRLRLLYKNKHHIDYSSKGDVYSAVLTLNLYHD